MATGIIIGSVALIASGFDALTDTIASFGIGPKAVLAENNVEIHREPIQNILDEIIDINTRAQEK